MSISICINPRCQHVNSDLDLFCTKCQSELLIEGQYRTLKILNDQGHYCDTYEVIDLEEQKPKVLKLLKQNDPKLVELFHREYQALNLSNHTGIPSADKIFEFPLPDIKTTVLCLIMEKIEGMDLEKFLNKRGTPIDQSMAVKWLKQLVLIIQEIHSHDVFHRDIKPSNIMLSNDGQLVLIDFGAVGLMSNLDEVRSGTVIYTQNYAAPEQMQGYAVPQSDFYALGRTFVHLLTGRHIPDQNSIHTQPGLPEPSINPWEQYVTNVSPALIELINSLMAREIEHRPTDTTAILRCLHNIENSADGTTVTRKTAPTAPRKIEPTEIIQQIPTSTGNLTANGENATPPQRRWTPWLFALSLLGLCAYGFYTFRPVRTGTSPSTNPANPSITPVAENVPVSPQCSENRLVQQQGSNLYGVIEIGSSGVKGEVVQELQTPNKAGNIFEPRSEDIEAQDVNSINPTAKTQTVKAVKEMYLEIQERFGIPCQHIVIYGSSGFATKANAGHQASLVQQIEAATGRSVGVITSEQEASYVFNAIVPDHRLDQVLMLDIGSGNTKGAFSRPTGGQSSTDTLSIPWGTKSVTQAIDNQRGSQAFVAALNQFREQHLPNFRQRTRLVPVLGSKSRIYLAGGITWSLATLVRPCQVGQTIPKAGELPSDFVQLYPADLTTFYNNITRDQETLFAPDLSKCTPEQRVQVQKDIDKIRTKVFTIDELTAGAELLRMLSMVLNFEGKEAIFFARYAFEALPIGYLKEQISQSKAL